MRFTLTTCDICGASYRVMDGKQETEKTFTIEGKTYDICVKCECNLLRHIDEMREGKPVETSRFYFNE